MALKLQGTNSAAAPGLTNDGNDGVAVGTDSIDLSIGGASKFKVASAGQLGIGGANYGTTGQVLKSAGASAAPTWGTVTSGLTEADQWRVTSSFTSDADPVTSNWERNDNSFDKVGTGMSESSGIFTFPSTGIWKIDYQASFNSTGNTHYGGAYVKATTDNSSYARIGYTYTSIDDGSGTWYGGASGTVMFDVTNVSTHKVCFEVGMDSATCMGSSTYQVTGLTFMKLGDT